MSKQHTNNIFVLSRLVNENKMTFRHRFYYHRSIFSSSTSRLSHGKKVVDEHFVIFFVDEINTVSLTPRFTRPCITQFHYNNYISSVNYLELIIQACNVLLITKLSTKHTVCRQLQMKCSLSLSKHNQVYCYPACVLVM